MSDAGVDLPPGWPVARLDPVRRLEVLAPALPGVVLRQRVLDAPVDDVWDVVGELPWSVPRFDRDVSRLRVVRRQGDRLRVHAWVPGVPRPVAFDVTLRRGWCWMVSDPYLYVVGMAAAPEGPGGSRTRFGHLEGLVTRGPAPLRAAAAPLLWLSRWRHGRHVERDLDGIERLVASGARPPGR